MCTEDKPPFHLRVTKNPPTHRAVPSTLEVRVANASIMHQNMNYVKLRIQTHRGGGESNFSQLWQTLALQCVPANSLKSPKEGICKARETISPPPSFSWKLLIAKIALNEHMIQNIGWVFSSLTSVSQPCDSICFSGVTPGL